MLLHQINFFRNVLLMCLVLSTNLYCTEGNDTLNVVMKGAIPDKDDDYLCTSYELPKKTNYIVKFEALADASIAHHILLFGCNKPGSNEKIWNCGQTCAGGDQILFAWAKNAPPTKLPPDVGMRVGGKTGINSIVLQVHYAHKSKVAVKDYSGIQLTMTHERPKFQAGIFLLMSYNFAVPPNTKVFHADISCKYDGRSNMYPFAYRTHAHSLGVVISGYQFNDTFHEIGKGNPQWPQAFYPSDAHVVVKPGDFLAGRCTFSSANRSRTTFVGATSKDEMCNFYIMFYTDGDAKNVAGTCYGNREHWLIDQLPKDSDKPLPPNPELDEIASGHHHHHHPELPELTTTSSVTTGVGHKITAPQGSNHLTKDQNITINFVGDWPVESEKLGQVGGVATDKNGNVYVFHRGERVWDQRSFDFNHVFQDQKSPISEDTIIVFDKNGKVIRRFGKNLFFMPHGIEIDNKGNIWLTDVALHQIFRYSPGEVTPNLTRGQKFQPGKDKDHFCKPSDVAVLSTGEFFVSDGYCNGRIMKFDKAGKLVKEWGTVSKRLESDRYPPTGTFSVVHSVTVAEKLGIICVADRENGRIQCFDLNGSFIQQMHPKEFAGRLFAVEFSPLYGGVLFAINGPQMIISKSKVQGFVIDLKTGKILSTFNTDKGLKNPHDITVDVENQCAYIGELDPSKVWKFHLDGSDHSVILSKKDEITVVKGDNDEYMPSLIIGALLIIPVVLLLLITATVRLYHAGKLQCFSFGRHSSKQKFNLGNFLNPHKGFDALSTEESDHEVEPWDDSDQEEFSIIHSSNQKA